MELTKILGLYYNGYLYTNSEESAELELPPTDRMLSLFVENQLAKTIFADSRTVIRTIGQKQKGKYLSNALST